MVVGSADPPSMRRRQRAVRCGGSARNQPSHTDAMHALPDGKRGHHADHAEVRHGHYLRWRRCRRPPQTATVARERKPMRISTDVDSLIAPGEAMPRGTVTAATPGHLVAQAGRHRYRAERCRRHRRRDRVVGQGGTRGRRKVRATSKPAPPPFQSCHRAASCARRPSLVASFGPREIVVAAFRAGGAIARHAYVRYRQHQRARAVYDTLRELDDHTLRDMGFDRSEIRSVAAELTGKRSVRGCVRFCRPTAFRSDFLSAFFFEIAHRRGP